MSGSTSTNNNTNINTITSSNNNNNSNGNREVSEDYTLFKFYMEKCYELPSELKNDIIYCQRAMRDFLKVHGLVSDVFKEQADADPVQMQRILDELEAEVYEINAEQNYLMLRLDEDLDIFYKKLEDSNIQTVPELGNEYISSLIVPLIGDASYKIYPQSVLMRDNEEMLIRKHFLISQDDEAGVEPLKLSELDDNVPLMLVNPSTATATLLDAQTTATTAANAGNELKLMQPENLFNMGDNSVGGLTTLLSTPTQAQSSLPLPPLLTQSKPSEHQQRSLLIPRGGSIAVEELPGGAVLSTQPPPLAMAKQVAGVVATVAAEISKPQTLKRSSTSPPPLAPITKVAATMATDFEVVAQSRMNLRQALRRARKTKQQPRLFDDEDALELPGSEKTAAQSTTALAPSSSSQVVSKQNKASLSKALAMELTTTAAAVSVAVAGVPSASSLAAKKSAQPAASKQYKTRNAYGAGRKPATPPPPSTVAGQHQAGSGAGAAASTARASSGSSGSSDDLHHELELEQQRLCASAAQWRDEPRETRVMPAEYGQEHFLGLFGLYTHDMVKKLCQRHSKRKRRTVQNASGVDFHYGQQLAAIDAVRQKKLKDKPEFLLSPKEKRLQAKKAHRAAAAAAASAVAATTGTTATRKSKSKTPEKLEDLFGSSQSVEGGKQKCKECRKRADNLMTCQSCQGFYHLDCHEDAKGKTVSPQSHSQLSIRCPQCVRDWTNTARAKCFS
ncbi:uncharacterized protein LOC117578262 [Drosophila albomicans]|uniref:Uncharacterized protein LOC117578262 n=1 Tax=Drosophila albomicans TaxID=7291 RepID=A0A6P8Y7Y1_DROAB|nr:uncharacterized protein LOC117578262 [Drosophila albomicans]